jgi:hypothetical protein
MAESLGQVSTGAHEEIWPVVVSRFNETYHFEACSLLLVLVFV